MLTVKDLKDLAKTHGIKVTGLKKAELVQLLTEKGVALEAKEEHVEHAEAHEPTAEPKHNSSKHEEVAEPTSDHEEGCELATKKEAKPKKHNSWNKFINEYSKTNNCTLKEAMKQKEAYGKWKAENAV